TGKAGHCSSDGGGSSAADLVGTTESQSLVLTQASRQQNSAMYSLLRVRLRRPSCFTILLKPGCPVPNRHCRVALSHCLLKTATMSMAAPYSRRSRKICSKSFWGWAVSGVQNVVSGV